VGITVEINYVVNRVHNLPLF